MIGNIGKAKIVTNIYLQYHLIFVCKYRKKLLVGKISNDIRTAGTVGIAC